MPGPLGTSQMSPTDEYNRRLRQQGLVPSQGGAAQPNIPGNGQQGFQGVAPLNKIYGLLAQYSDNPAQVGNAYVSAQQTQQAQDRQNLPLENFLRLYGRINPHDYDPTSIQKFHQNFIRTGQLQFDMLRERKTMSTVEQQILKDATDKAMKAESAMGQAADLANRYDEIARQGTYEGRLAGGISEWLKGVLGTEDEVSRVRTEYEQLKNSNVIQNLPPGVASDRDIEIAMRGWPSSTAKSSYVAAFLRGTQKMRALQHAQATYEASYLSLNKSQEGELESWNMNRNTYAMQALNQFGGVYAPKNPDGTAMDADKAADYFYGIAPSATPGQLVPGQGAGTPLTDDQLVRKWGGK